MVAAMPSAEAGRAVGLQKSCLINRAYMLKTIPDFFYSLATLKFRFTTRVLAFRKG